jgi:hypothetical protein
MNLVMDNNFRPQCSAKNNSKLNNFPISSNESLIISLRSAWAKDNVLDKEVTSHNDVLDAFRLALRPFKEQTIME